MLLFSKRCEDLVSFREAATRATTISAGRLLTYGVVRWRPAEMVVEEDPVGSLKETRSWHLCRPHDDYNDLWTRVVSCWIYQQREECIVKISCRCSLPRVARNPSRLLGGRGE